MTLVSFDMEDFEVITKSWVKISSWMDWWLVTVQRLANSMRPHDTFRVPILQLGVLEGLCTGRPSGGHFGQEASFLQATPKLIR